MPRGATELISNNEANFIVQALRGEQRLDGRRPFDFRQIEWEFAADDSGAEVLLGRTRVLTAISAELVPPFADRGNEGRVQYNVEFSPMASPAFEAGRPGDAAQEVVRLVERALRDSHAVDLEALCVIAGRRVWYLRVDIHVLDADGNLTDAVVLSALAALLSFRRPDVSVGGADGSEVIVHSAGEKETVPLSIHHLPFALTFAFFGDGDLVVLDPGSKEEAAQSGRLTVVVNAHKEVCAVQKLDGVPLPSSMMLRCIRIAASKVEELTQKLREALDAHEVARIQRRIRRHTPAVATDANVAGGVAVQ